MYDPKVSEESIYADMERLGTQSSKEIRDKKVVNSAEEACKDAHAVVILTEWDELNNLYWKAVYEDVLKPTFLFYDRSLLNKAD